MTDSPFGGVIPILYAFFDKGGQLDRARMRDQVRALLTLPLRVRPQHIAVLGFATEAHKLSLDEKVSIVHWLAEDANGDTSLVVTLTGDTPAGQIKLLRAALDAGAHWFILQPPKQRRLTTDEAIAFFSEMMSATSQPVAIQHAPEFTGLDLGLSDLVDLRTRHPNFTFLKGEGPAISISALITETQGKFAVFNGRGGLEFLDNLRAGCAGIIPAPEIADQLARLYELHVSAQHLESETLYHQLLPLIVFGMQSLDTLICYGKRAAALRLGLGEVHDRAPGLLPTAFGLAALERHLGGLPAWGEV